ncbi:MAG: hypothetical protein ACREIT_06720 [Tepidisphaeraceae bacterium]
MRDKVEAKIGPEILNQVNVARDRAITAAEAAEKSAEKSGRTPSRLTALENSGRGLSGTHYFKAADFGSPDNSPQGGNWRTARFAVSFDPQLRTAPAVLLSITRVDFTGQCAQPFTFWARTDGQMRADGFQFQVVVGFPEGLDGFEGLSVDWMAIEPYESQPSRAADGS